MQFTQDPPLVCSTSTFLGVISVWVQLVRGKSLKTDLVQGEYFQDRSQPELSSVCFDLGWSRYSQEFWRFQFAQNGPEFGQL